MSQVSTVGVSWEILNPTSPYRSASRITWICSLKVPIDNLRPLFSCLTNFVFFIYIRDRFNQVSHQMITCFTCNTFHIGLYWPNEWTAIKSVLPHEVQRRWTTRDRDRWRGNEKKRERIRKSDVIIKAGEGWWKEEGRNEGGINWEEREKEGRRRRGEQERWKECVIMYFHIMWTAIVNLLSF